VLLGSCVCLSMPDKKIKKYVPEIVRSYLAKMGMHRDHMYWNEEKSAWNYPVGFWGKDTEESVARYVETLPLVVPGLVVVASGLKASIHYRGENDGTVWFTWNEEDMWARIQKIFDEYGVADERLAYRKCSGSYTRTQPSLPGTVQTEPQGTSSSLGDGRYFATAYTQYGLSEMNGAFAQRIMEPNRGGPYAIPFSNQRCEVGDDWWLVGSKGDSPEIMSLEIQGSPLDSRTKINLLYNLKNCRS